MAARRSGDDDVGMENKRFSSVIDAIELEARPEFNVVVAYDEFAAGVCAKGFFDSLACAYGNLFQFRCQLWKFDVLGLSHLLEAAARDAAGADMVVFAIRESQQLPADVRRWINRWLPFKQADSSAFVLLLGGESGHAGSSTGARATLRELAEGASLRFFFRVMDWPVMGSDFAAESIKPQFREELRGDTPLVNLYAGQPRWGLNEY